MRRVKDGGATHEFPEDSDKEIWVEDFGGLTLLDIVERAAEKWPDKSIADIDVDVVYHHQYNIYYDLHDSSDYVKYVVLSID